MFEVKIEYMYIVFNLKVLYCSVTVGIDPLTFCAERQITHSGISSVKGYKKKH